MAVNDFLQEPVEREDIDGKSEDLLRQHVLFSPRNFTLINLLEKRQQTNQPLSAVKNILQRQ